MTAVPQELELKFTVTLLGDWATTAPQLTLQLAAVQALSVKLADDPAVTVSVPNSRQAVAVCETADVAESNVRKRKHAYFKGSFMA
jgi:hypothetical protein